jgi:hypothetical protein
MINLLGLGASGLAETVSPTLQKEIDGFLLQSPKPSSSDVANFLKLYSGEARNVAAQALIARGIAAATIASALTFLNTSGGLSRNSIWGLLSLASAGACAYHGVKRNNGSIGWGAWWISTSGCSFFSACPPSRSTAWPWPGGPRTTSTLCWGA